MTKHQDGRPPLDLRLVNQHSFSKEELIAGANGRLFGPGRARLPIGNMLMIDRVTHIDQKGGAYNKGKVQAEMDIHPDLWFFGCHFIEDPVMPGCLGLDALWQLVGFFMAWKGNWGVGRALGCGKVTFRGQVLPSARLLQYDIDILRSREGKNVMGVGDCQVLMDGKQIYTAKEVKVGLFTSLEDFEVNQ